MKTAALLLSFVLSLHSVIHSASKPFIDVVIPCTGKDVETLELCIDGIKKYCSPVRRIIVLSDQRYTDNAEWADETKLYPFTKETIAYEIFRGDAQAAHNYLKSPRNRISWFYQQFLKLYAPLVIPVVAEDVLIVDADVIFLNHVDFIDALGYRLYGSSAEYNPLYFDFNSKLVPGLKRTLNLSGICHHTLMRRTVIKELFDIISKVHQNDVWRAMCRLIDGKKLVTHFEEYLSPMAENELYPNFAHTHDPFFKIRHLRFINSNMLDKIPEYSKTYHFAAFHSWMRNGGKWHGEPNAQETMYNIVFIHIGPHLPPYIVTAIKQARLFNKLCPIYLISSKSALSEFAQSPHAASDTICVDYHQLPLTGAHHMFLANCTLEKFWQEATERYLVLYDFMSYFNIQNVFHLENDVLLYVNLNELVPAFKDNYSVAIPFDNDTRAISSFVYVKDRTSLQKVAVFFAQKAASGLNDMQTPPLLKQMDSTIIGQLPIIMPAYVRSYPLKNKLGYSTKNPTDYTNNFESFNCIFDAAAIGQYLGGIDPRCGKAGPGFINETCLFNPSQLQYVWECNCDGLRVPYAVFNGKKYLIANLHIHSKNLALFKSFIEDKIPKIGKPTPVDCRRDIVQNNSANRRQRGV